MSLESDVFPIETRKQKERKKEPTRYLQKHGSVVIVQEEPYNDLVIREGDIQQSLRWYRKLKEIENEPVVPKDAETRDRLMWLPTEDKEALLRTWHRRRRDYVEYCMLRITVPIDELERILREEEAERQKDTRKLRW